MVRLPSTLLVALLTLGAVGTALAAEAHRILVDKVLMRDGMRMESEHVAAIADAGFTAVSPRWGNDDPAEVRRVASLAARHGLRFLPWCRGTLVAAGDDDGPRLVWADGGQQELYAPDSDSLWAWLHRRVLDYARASVEQPAILGVFLDFENYAPGAQGNGYSLSYDRQILRRFAATHGVELPDLAPSQRHDWLQSHSLHDAFETFQVERWRQRTRQLREAVDAINPAFRFCVYPAPGTPFLRRAVWPEWSTEAAPLMLADPVSYGRPPLAAHGEALVANRERLQRRRAEAPDEAIYLGGIDPVVPGADPEFSGRNAVSIADVVDGYWVFYEGPQVDGEHPAYFDWFARANRRIVDGDLDWWQEPRSTPESGPALHMAPRGSRPVVGHYGLKPRMVAQLDSTGLFDLHPVEFLGADYLAQFDAVLLQNLNLEIPFQHEHVQALRSYVEQGGGVLLAHDTAWFMDSPVPEIARRAVPTQSVEAGRHVVETDLLVLANGELDTPAGAVFQPEFRDHMIFAPGPEGIVVARNVLGDAVYVAGVFGRGRAVFAGSYYGYSGALSRTERDLLVSCLVWLTQ